MSAPALRPWLFAIAACLWWSGVFVYDAIRFTHPDFSPWIEWRQMDSAYRMGPWIASPFIAAVLWSIALRVKAGRVLPSWMIWGWGAAALLWAAFVFWRAHDQAFTCAVWAPPEELWRGDTCFMPHLLASALPWLVVPIAAWLVLAASGLRVAGLRGPFKPVS